MNARLFKFYLMGRSVDDLQRMNHAFTLGLIVRAKVEGDWDERRLVYTNELLDGVKDRVKMTQLEAVHFVADQLGVAHASFRERFMRYLESGDEAVLGELAIKNVKQYRESIDLLLHLTGQNNPVKKVETKHTVKVEQSEPKPEPQKALPPAPDNATLLGLLDVPEK